MPKMHAEPATPESWLLEINPPWERVEALRSRLREYNAQMGQTHEGTGLAIFIRDEAGALIGGISAWLWGTTLEVNFLWLADSLRGQGIGQRLMERIEKAAVERGARQAILSTYSFQAPDFYLRLGYEVLAAVDGLGNNHQKFYLRKRL